MVTKKIAEILHNFFELPDYNSNFEGGYLATVE